MNLCIYCGTSFGAHPDYKAAAVATAQRLAAEGIGIVYGGAKVGLMGTVADAALAAGGRVIGVIPRGLVEREIAHQGLTETHVVETMHERKTLMSELSDGFIALPGGPGTFEEILEQWTWILLGLHAKPCGFLNVRGYFDAMREMMVRMVRDDFVRRDFVEKLVFEPQIGPLLERFRSYEPPPPKWADPPTP